MRQEGDVVVCCWCASGLPELEPDLIRPVRKYYETKGENKKVEDEKMRAGYLDFMKWAKSSVPKLRWTMAMVKITALLKEYEQFSCFEACAVRYCSTDT